MGDSQTTRWQPHEDAVLRANPSLTARQLKQQLPGRGLTGIKERRRRIGAPPTSAAWPVEKVAWLRQLVEMEKHSSTAAAKRMRITRNAVISQCRKFGIKLPNQPHSSPAQRRAATKLNQERKAERTAAARGSAKHPDGKNNNPSGWTGRHGSTRGPDGLPAPMPSQARVAIADLTRRHCRYIGDRPELITIDTPIYCGAATDGGSWCPTHKAGVFQPTRTHSLMGLAKLR